MALAFAMLRRVCLSWKQLFPPGNFSDQRWKQWSIAQRGGYNSRNLVDIINSSGNLDGTKTVLESEVWVMRPKVIKYYRGKMELEIDKLPDAGFGSAIVAQQLR